MKINSLKKQKHEYLIHTWSDKAFKGTVVNQHCIIKREGKIRHVDEWTLSVKESLGIDHQENEVGTILMEE